MYTPRRRSSNAGLWVAVAVIVLLGFVAGALIAKAYGTHHEVTTTVASKERVCSGSGKECKYLLFTGHGTYKITDAFLVGTTRFNSSDVYGRIHPCHSYRITYYGWRLPYLSAYPNVVSADDLGRDRSCTPD